MGLGLEGLFIVFPRENRCAGMVVIARFGPSCVTVAPVPDALHGHMRAVMGGTLQLPDLAELQGGLGAAGWAEMCISPPHLPLLVAGTMYCPSFGQTWLHFQP